MVELTNKELIEELEREAEKIHNSTRVDMPLFSPVHNYLRSKSATYYKWSISDKSNKIHITGALSFVVSVFVFTFIQFVWPNLFVPKPDTTLAASNSHTWTTQQDFESATTSSNITTTVEPGSVLLEPTEKGLLIGSGTSQNLFSISFANSSVGYISGSGGTILKTVNGGSTWSTQSVGSSVNLTGIYSPSDNIAYAVADGVYKTIDGGLNWQNYNLGYTLLNIHGSGENNIQTVSTTRIFKSIDGINWVQKYLTSNTQIQTVFVGPSSIANAGSIAGGGIGRSFYSTNNGESWSVGTTDGLSYTSIRDIYFVTSTVGYAVADSGKIYKSTNGGVSWTSQTSGISDQLRSVWFKDINTGYAAGANGVILKTKNGGSTWFGLNSGTTQTINDIYVADNETYFVGNQGVIIKLIPTYPTSGNMGSHLTNSVGLKADIGEGIKAKAVSLNWSGSTNSAGQKLLFTLRVGDSQEELNSSLCYGSSGSGNCSSWWTNPGGYFSQINGQANSSSSVISSISSKRYIEVLVRLESNGNNTPTLNDITLVYDTLESPDNNQVILYRSDGLTKLKNLTSFEVNAGVPGGWSSESTVRVSVNGLTCSGCSASTGRKIQVQYNPTGAAFINETTNLVTGSYIDNITSTATITGLIPGNYHLRLRIVDDQGRVSGWTNYGDNNNSFFGYEKVGQIDAMDATTGWTVTGGSLSINSSNKVQGSGSFNLNKTTTSSKSVYLTRTISSSNLANSGVATQVFISNESILSKIDKFQVYLFSSGGHIFKNFLPNDLKVGWNLLYFDTKTPSGSSGLVDLSAINSVRIQFDSVLNSDTWTTGSISLDDFSRGSIIYHSDFSIEQTPPTGTMTINEGEYTKTATVNLTLSASDTGGSGLSQMRFSNDGTNWSSWESYATSKAWTLISGDGVKIVYAQYRDNAGNVSSSEASDSIIFDTTKPSFAEGTIISPTSGDQWVGGTKRNITWDPNKITDTLSGLVDNPITLKFSQNNGSSWSNIVTTLPNNGSYEWNVPNTSCVNTCRVAILSTDKSGNTSVENDARSGSFSITADNTPPIWDAGTFLDISSADKYISGSDTWTRGTTTLSWASAADPESGIDFYQILLSPENTVKETNINTNSKITTFSEGAYTWYVKVFNGAGDSSNTKDDLTPSVVKTIRVDTTAPTGFLLISPRLNNGITATKSNLVNLSVSNILDTGSGYKDLQFSNNSTGPWTSFQSATSFTSWNLADTEYGGNDQKGTKTVYLRLRDNVGNVSAPISQTIVWEDTAPNHPVPQVQSSNNQTSSYVNGAWIGNSSAVISWSEPNDPDPSSEVYQYFIYRSMDNASASAASYLQTTFNLSIEDTGLIDGHSYYYFIQAVDNAQNSSNYLVGATSAELVLSDITSPAESVNFTAVGADSTKIDISWQSAPENSTSNGGKANFYIVEATGPLGSSQPVEIPQNEAFNRGLGNISFEQSGIYESENDRYTITDNVQEEQWYYYRIQAFDEGNRASLYTYYVARGNFAPIFNQESINIQVSGGRTIDNALPGDTITVTFVITDADGRGDLDTGNASQNIRIQNGSLDTVLNWTQVTNKQNYQDNGYTYTYQYNIPPNANYGTYTISINVKDSVAVGSPGDNTHNQLGTSSFKIPPTSPISFSSTGYSSTSIKLSWTAPPNSGLRASQTYQIQRQKQGQAEFEQVGFTTNINFTDSSLEMDISYTYRVRAYDVSGNAGTYSVSSSATTPKPARPDGALVKNASHTSSALGGSYPVRFLVSWDAVTSQDVPDFKGYQVFRSTDGVWDPNPIASIDCNSLGYNQAYFLDVHPVFEEGKDFKYAVKTLDQANNTGDSVETQSTSATVTPQITSQPEVVERGVSWVRLTWKSSQPSYGVAQYKKTNENIYSLAGREEVTTTQEGSDYVHTLTVRGLDKGTNYHFKVKSINSVSLMSASSSEITASTLPFNIQSIQKQTTATSATISWNTPGVSSEGYIEYRQSDGASQVIGTAKQATNHTVNIRDLAPGDYVFTLKNIDPEGTVTTSSLESFKITGFDTGSLSAPQAGQISEQDITATSAKITWTSTIPTSSWVDYGTQPGSYTKSTGNNSLSLGHIVSLEALTPGTTYYYIVKGTDANGTEYKSQEYSFTAQSRPSISKVEVYEIKSYTARVRISATKEVEASFTYGTDNKFDLKAGSTTLAKDHDLEIQNLEDDKNYSYYVDVKDQQGNTVRSEVKTFSTPKDVNPPVLTDIKLSPLSGSDQSKRGVIITWSTDKPATSQVAYGAGLTPGKYSSRTPEDSSLKTSHTVVINNLDSGTTYHFQLVSKDRRGNEGASSDYTLITQQQEESVLELILRTLEDTFSWVGKVGSFVSDTFKKLFSIN